MKTDDNERARKVPAKTYPRKSFDGNNPSPPERDAICTTDPTPILKRPYG
jgi:hypothetical protein